MHLTGSQLLYLRNERGFTREKLADFLGDCSPSTINKWERDINPVPAWVAEKMLRELPIDFTVEQLEELILLAKQMNCGFMQLLKRSIQDYVAHHLRTGASPVRQHLRDVSLNESPTKYRTGSAG